MQPSKDSGDSPTGPGPDARYTVRSVARSLRLIDIVADHPAGLTLSEVSRELGASKSATYSLLRTLLDAGYLLEVQPGPRYELGFALLRLGDAVSRQLAIADVCRPVLQQLTDATGMTSRAAIADRGRPVFVERVDGPGSVRFHTALGRREMPHVSSAGKAILAELSDDEIREVVAEAGLVSHSRNTITSLDALFADLEVVRRRGYAVDDEEDAEGVLCVGAAFFDHAGRCAGALSTTCIKVDMPSWRIEEIGRTVREHAVVLTQRLGGQPRSPQP